MESNTSDLATYQSPRNAVSIDALVVIASTMEDSTFSIDSSSDIDDDKNKSVVIDVNSAASVVPDVTFGCVKQSIITANDEVYNNNENDSDLKSVLLNSAIDDQNIRNGDIKYSQGNSNASEVVCNGGTKTKRPDATRTVDTFGPTKKQSVDKSKVIPKTHRHNQPWVAVKVCPVTGVTENGVPAICADVLVKSPAKAEEARDVPQTQSSDMQKPPPSLSDSEEVEHSGLVWYKRYSRRQLMTLMSLCLVDFTCFLGMSIMAPFFPMEAGNKGMDEATVGFVFSMYALVMFIASPIFGRILPTVGANFLFLSGLFLSGGCTVLFGILDEINGQTFTVMCFVIRSFEALGAAAYNTASCTIVAEMFPDNIGAVFGMLETFVGLGMTVGPALGAALYALQGYKLPFLLLGGFMILMVPINMFLLPKQHTSNVNVKAGSITRLLRLPTVAIMCVVVVVQASAWSFLDPFLQPHLEIFSLSTETVGLVFLMMSATYGIFCPIWGWVADRWEHTSIMMVCGMIGSSVALVLLGPSDVLLPQVDNYLWLNMVSLVILGVATALAIIPTFQSMMDYALDAGFEDGISTYSVVSGLWSAAYSFGDFVGPSVGGVLVKAFAFPNAATGVAGLILCGAGVLIAYESVVSCSSTSGKDEAPIIPEKTKLDRASETTPLLKSV